MTNKILSSAATGNPRTMAEDPAESCGREGGTLEREMNGERSVRKTTTFAGSGFPFVSLQTSSSGHVVWRFDTCDIWEKKKNIEESSNANRMNLM